MEDERIPPLVEQVVNNETITRNVPSINPFYDVRIETLDEGYVIRVGCKAFAIQNKEVLISMLTKYFNNPEELQKQFINKTLIIK